MSHLDASETFGLTTSKGEPTISIIIAWKDRREIAIALQQNRNLFVRYNAEVIVVVSGSTSAALSSVLPAPERNSIRCICIGGSQFNKSMAINAGLFFAKSPNIFILDADVLLTEDVIGPALQNLSGSAFCGIEWLDELRTSSSAALAVKVFNETFGISRGTTVQREVAVKFDFGDGKSIRQIVIREHLNHGARSAPGLIIVRKMHLIKIGGYNSHVTTWGWEDNDVLLRLQYVLGLKKIEIGRALHLSHGDDLRVLPPEGAYVSNMKNLAYFCALYSQGEYSGTYFEDVAPLNELNEVPSST